jgi:hypothetical protein
VDRRGVVAVSVALATVVAASVLARPASAHFDTVTSHLFWAFSTCPSDPAKRRAPVNVVFYNNATASTSLNFLHAALPAWTFTDGAQWRYQSHADCALRDWQRASAPTSIAVGATRYLIEMRHTFDADAKWGKTTIGTVRREKKTASCMAAVSPNGYDQGRWYLQSHLPSFGFRSTYWGNTQTFSQCDGTAVGSNGYTFWFRVP